MKKLLQFLFLTGLISNIACSSDTSNDEVLNVEPQKEETELASLNTGEATNILAFTATISAKIEDYGGSSVREQGICYSLSPSPDYNSNRKQPSTVKGSGEFEVKLTDLDEDKTYYARAFAKNAKGISYGNEVSFKTSIAEPPQFKIGEIKVRGPHDIWTDLNLTERGEDELKEIGLIYAKEPTFSIESGTKLKQEDLGSAFKYRITDLEANTTYFYKPYAITAHDKIHYGEVTEYKTLEQGNFTWSFNGTLDPNNENHQRIKEAFDKAVWYYSNYTSLQKHVTVNYSPGTPTADANFDGWINMGPNPSYQQTGTALHEMAHTVGVGTHWIWKFIIDDDDSYYSPTRAEAVLSMMTNGAETKLNNGGIHFWPYGINGAHEDSGDDFLYIMNALIVQGFKEDGLPSN